MIYLPEHLDISLRGEEDKDGAFISTSQIPTVLVTEKGVAVIEDVYKYLKEGE